MQRYNPKDIEPKWQAAWAASGIYKAEDFSSKPKYVMLTEFPYPSGDGLHMGHTREYTYGDILARYKRMHGYNVLFPMGYDAFGLPTENYAIKQHITPQAATDANVANFQKQLESFGLSIDWSRSFRTTDPEYYKWTQWLFLQFFKHGLAYQKESAISWCPFCKTGLSNEEVVNGRHERCDTLVEKKVLPQWMLRITDYADRLIDGLKDLDFPSRIADQQINWIGRSEGAEVKFYDVDDDDETNPITVYTTRADTIYGATFLVLAPEHPLVEQLTRSDHAGAVATYVKAAAAKSDIERQDTDREKTGVFTGAYATNPLTAEYMPVWVADYVLAGYGTGAIMAVPAHDERDWAFAKKYDLKITRVIDSDTPEDSVSTGPGKLINSGNFDGMPNVEAKTAIINFLAEDGLATLKTQYRLRDWIFSRQRYWGEPIPIIHCPEHGAVAVPEDQLPVVLPAVDNYEPSDDAKSPLSRVPEWVNTTCPTCGKPAQRETDTMPNWAGSSWYYLRYFDAHNDTVFADRKKLDYWGEVDLYMGGMEHTTLHLLYSRFWHEFFYDQGLVPTPEPYKARRGQGIILAADGTKMSKSKGNVVNPSEIIDSGYGADAMRLSIAFLAPYDQTTPWNPEGVAGTHRFLQRLWQLVQGFIEANEKREGEPLDDSIVQADILRTTHHAIKRVTTDLDTLGFNTAISAQMEALNQLYKLRDQDEFLSVNAWQAGLEAMVQLVAPFAPHFAEELWQQLGHEVSVHTSAWPQYDEANVATDEVTLAVQINGKLRSEITVAAEADEATTVAAAQADIKIAPLLEGKTIRKTIYVAGKIVNFVVG
ncbi:MAG: leucine--tRNA ligase [Candidatus Saccharibacteria bacterium]|nr:leucine--tRNA ligase [Candidatus Saccharibacteria bacterium]